MMTTQGPANSAVQMTDKDPAYHVVTEDDLVMLYELGLLARELGKLQQAEAIFLGILNMRSRVAGGYMGLSSIYMDQGRLDEALQLLQTTVTLEGKHRDLGQAFLGSTLLRAGRAREAERILRPVAESGRENNGVTLAQRLLESEVQEVLAAKQASGIPQIMGR